MTENVFQDGPYLQAATLCEHVLEEKDGVKTAVRMVDRLIITSSGPGAPETIPPNQGFSGYLLIKLRKGHAGGRHELRIELVNPANESISNVLHTVTFEGGADRGVDLVGKMKVETDRDGIYWFNVYLDDIQITRIPLRVIYLREQTIQGALPGQPTH